MLEHVANGETGYWMMGSYSIQSIKYGSCVVEQDTFLREHCSGLPFGTVVLDGSYRLVWNVAVVAEVGEVKGTAVLVLVWRKLAIVYISTQTHCQS